MHKLQSQQKYISLEKSLIIDESPLCKSLLRWLTASFESQVEVKLHWKMGTQQACTFCGCGPWDELQSPWPGRVALPLAWGCLSTANEIHTWTNCRVFGNHLSWKHSPLYLALHTQTFQVSVRSLTQDSNATSCRKPCYRHAQSHRS